MLKQSSSRNQRAKGCKVKHALQVLVLVAVCIWLLYQVKHSHNKKRALEARDAKISSVVPLVGDNHSDFLRFGRKDLPQIATETTKEAERRSDDEENEEAEQGEAENKPEEGDEEEGKGVDEDEIDENDRKGEGANEGENSEEPGDNEEKEGQSDEKDSSSNQEQDNKEENGQEAREEHYKGDDASSAVVRDTEVTESEGRSDIEDKIENAEKDPDANITTKGAENDLKIDESVIPSETSEIHLSNNVSMKEIEANLTLLHYDNQREKQGNSNLEPSIMSSETQNNYTKDVDVENDDGTPLLNSTGSMASGPEQNSTLFQYDNLREKEGNSNLDPSIMSTETQKNYTKGMDVEIDGSPFLNSTISTTSDPDQNSTTVETGTEEVSNSTDDGNPKSEKFLIEQTTDSNSTDGAEKVEENFPTPSITKEVDDAVQTDSNDPLAKVGTVAEKEGDSFTSSASQVGENEVRVDSNDQLALVDADTEGEKGSRADISTLPEMETETKVEEIAAE